MAGRIAMSSPGGYGRRIIETGDERPAAYVTKGLPMFGRPKQLQPRPAPRGTDRRSFLQGGGAAFVERQARKHPFGAAFGASLLALKVIHGADDRGLI